MGQETRRSKEEPCEDCIRHGESEIHRESEVADIRGTTVGSAGQSHPSQLESIDLLGA